MNCLVCEHEGMPVVLEATATAAQIADPAYYVPTYSARGLHGEIRSCRRCGFMTVDPPSREVLRSAYERMSDDRYLSEAEAYRGSFRRVLDTIESFQVPGKRLLEAGCGPGYFLEEARERGWAAVGVELSKAMAEEARRKFPPDAVIQGDFETPALEGRTFDVIVGAHIVEHVADPAKFIQKCRARLADDGLLYLVTPDASSLTARVLYRRWWYFQIPHLHYFSPDTLGRLLKRHGFVVECVKPFRRLITPEIIRHRIDFLAPRWRAMAKALLWPLLALRWSVALNTFDQLEVIARKRSDE